MLTAQFHGRRVEAVRFANEMQGAAADALYVPVARPHGLPGIAADERADGAVPRMEIGISSRVEAVELADGEGATAARRLGKLKAFPVRLVELVVAGRVKTRSGFEQQYGQPLFAEAPGGSGTTGPGPDNNGVKALAGHAHGGG